MNTIHYYFDFICTHIHLYWLTGKRNGFGGCAKENTDTNSLNVQRSESISQFSVLWFRDIYTALIQFDVDVCSLRISPEFR